jgi:TPR repeat protein
MEEQKFKVQIKLLRNLSQWKQILDLIITEKLQNVWFQTFQGEALFYLSRQEEAEKVFESVIHSCDTNDMEHMFLLGKTYHFLGDSQKSNYWLEKAAELGEPNSQNNLGTFYVKKKEYSPKARKKQF